MSVNQTPLLRAFSKERFSAIAFVMLVITTFVIGSRWYALVAPSPAPSLPNWNWNAHRSVALVTYFPDCGCSNTLFNVAAESAARGQEVLILTHETKNKIADWEQRITTDRIKVITSVDEALLVKLSPNRKIVSVSVQDGIIRR